MIFYVINKFDLYLTSKFREIYLEKGNMLDGVRQACKDNPEKYEEFR